MSSSFNEACRLLTQREQSGYELRTKLQNKGFSLQESVQAIEQCQRLHLQSDQRFAEMLCRTRMRQGYGPIRIHHELKMKGIELSLASSILMEHEDQWAQHALDVWKKKFKTLSAKSPVESNKQRRFMHYRGFPTALINNLVKQIAE